MKKVVKGKIALENALVGVPAQADETYQFLIKIEMVTSLDHQMPDTDSIDLRQFCMAHARFRMAVEVRLRSLLVQMDQECFRKKIYIRPFPQILTENRHSKS